MGITNPYRFPSQCKTCSQAPFLKLIWARRQPVRCSSLQASILCTTVAHVYSMFPSQLKRREKRWLSGLESSASLASGKGPPAWRSGTKTLCQSRLPPPVRDREFGYCTKMSGRTTEYIYKSRVEIMGVYLPSQLEHTAHQSLYMIVDIVKGGGREPPPPGLIFPSWWKLMPESSNCRSVCTLGEGLACCVIVKGLSLVKTKKWGE